MVAQARAQTDQAVAAYKMQIELQQAQNAAIHLQAKAQTEAGLAKLKADLDAHIKATAARQLSPSRPGMAITMPRTHSGPANI